MVLCNQQHLTCDSHCLKKCHSALCPRLLPDIEGLDDLDVSAGCSV
jgi:hypothetical protein